MKKRGFGLIQVYTGEGKGKTTSSLGIALRAIGHNRKVHMVQFMKGYYSGEVIASMSFLPQLKINSFGAKCENHSQHEKDIPP